MRENKRKTIKIPRLPPGLGTFKKKELKQNLKIRTLSPPAPSSDVALDLLVLVHEVSRLRHADHVDVLKRKRTETKDCPSFKFEFQWKSSSGTHSIKTLC